jgi:hypothetical protein
MASSPKWHRRVMRKDLITVLGGVAQVVEQLARKHQALSSNPRITKREKVLLFTPYNYSLTSTKKDL